MQMILLEHDAFTPGTVYNEELILGGTFGGILNEMVINEGSNLLGESVKFKGKFQEAEAVNKNKRMYPFNILDSNVKRLTESLEKGGLVGELDHPTDSIIHFQEASHKITRLWWEGKVLMGEGFILNTPSGKILRSLLNDGVRVGISSRGVGNGKVNEEGILVIGESYKLITFDAVADPSTNAAFQEKFVSRRESAETLPMPEKQDNVGKNVFSSINRINNKELVLACLEGIVHKQANEIKARLTNG
jgi:hypothetical protein